MNATALAQFALPGCSCCFRVVHRLPQLDANCAK